MAVLARDVIKHIEAWHPRGCKTEKEFEISLHRHLEKNFPDDDVQKQYASGRVKGDICVGHKVLIELKYGLKSTAQVQRLLGQLDLYKEQWKKEVVVIVCGNSDRDLIRQVVAKVDALKPQGFFQEQSIFLVLRGSAAPAKGKGFWEDFW